MADLGEEESLEDLERSVVALCEEVEQGEGAPSAEMHPTSSGSDEHGSFVPISPIHPPGQHRSGTVSFCSSTPNAKDFWRTSVLNYSQGYPTPSAREKTFEEVLAEVSSLCGDWNSGLDDTVVQNKDTGGGGFRGSFSKIDWNPLCARQTKIPPCTISLIKDQKASLAEMSQPGYFSGKELSALPSSPGRFSTVDTSRQGDKTLCAEDREEEVGEDTLGLDHYVSFVEEEVGTLPRSDEEDLHDTDAAWVTLSKVEMDRDITSVEPPQLSFSQESSSGANIMNSLPCFSLQESLKNSLDGSGHDLTQTPKDNTQKDSICSDSLLTADAATASAKGSDGVLATKAQRIGSPGSSGLNASISGESPFMSGGSGAATHPSGGEGVVSEETVPQISLHDALCADMTSANQTAASSSHGLPETSAPLSFRQLSETVVKEKDAFLICRSRSRKRKRFGELRHCQVVVCAKSFWASAVKEAGDVEPPSKIAAAGDRSLVSDKRDQGPSQMKFNWEMPDSSKLVQPEGEAKGLAKPQALCLAGGQGGRGAKEGELYSVSRVEDVGKATPSVTGLDTKSSVTRLDTKASVTDLDTKSSVTRLDTKASVTDLDTKSSVTRLDTKASVTDLDTKSSVTRLDTKSSVTRLDTKASVTDLDTKSSVTRLDTKASVTRLDTKASVTRLDTKASVTRVDTKTSVTGLDTKSSVTRLDTKASVIRPDTKSSVTRLDTKASVTGLDTKASVTGLDTKASVTGLDTKSSVTRLDTNSSVTRLDTKTSVTRLDTKASVTGLDTKASVTGLDTKASVTRLDTKSSVTRLDTKASVTSLDTKASVTRVDTKTSVTGLDTKSSVTRLDTKASVIRPDTKSSVTRLDTKASVTGLDTKARVTGLDTKASVTGLDTKASVTRLDTKSSVTRLDTKSSVTRLDTKASVTGLDTKASVTGLDTKSSVTSLDTKASVTRLDTKASVTGLDTNASVTRLDTKASVTGLDTNASVTRPVTAHQTPAQQDIISAEENKLMREVRKRWETGIVRPDVNLTCCNYLHRRSPGASSLLEGNFRKPPLLRHLDRLHSGGPNSGQQGGQDFSSGCISLLDELKHQLGALRQDHRQKEQAAKWALCQQLRQVLQEKEVSTRWLLQEQRKEQEETMLRLSHTPLLQEHRLLLLQEEHQQQRQQQQQHYSQRQRLLYQHAHDKEKQERQRFQHLERQLVEMVQLFGQKDSQQAGERHVLVSLWKGPCRTNNNRRSWVQVGLPADIASYIWREDNIYDFFYSYQ